MRAVEAFAHPFALYGHIQPRVIREIREGEEQKMKPLWSVEKAAELLGLSPWTLRAYIRDGRLRPVRLGRRVLLEESELERFVARSKSGGTVTQNDATPNSTGAML